MNSYVPINERWEWVEIMEPKTKNIMYVNLASGDCVWDPPPNVQIKKMDRNQWWELYDSKTCRFYYYNAFTESTVWYKPANVDIIPLAKLQILKQNTEVPLDNSARKEMSTQTAMNAELRFLRRSASHRGSGHRVRKPSLTSSVTSAPPPTGTGSRRPPGGDYDNVTYATAGAVAAAAAAAAVSSGAGLPASGAATPTQAGPSSGPTTKAFQTWSTASPQQQQQQCRSPLPSSSAVSASTASPSVASGSTLPSALKRRHHHHHPHHPHDTLASNSSSTSSCTSPLARAFDEQCTVSETSVDSGLPPDNSSWDSLDSQSDATFHLHHHPHHLGGASSFRLPPGAVPTLAGGQASTPQHHYASIVVTPGGAGGSSSGPGLTSPLASSANVSSHYGTPMISRHHHHQRAFPRTNPTCSMSRGLGAAAGSVAGTPTPSGSGPLAATPVTVSSAISCISIASEAATVAGQASLRDSTGSSTGTGLPSPATVVESLSSPVTSVPVGPSQSNMSVSSSGTESTLSGPQPPQHSVHAPTAASSTTGSTGTAPGAGGKPDPAGVCIPAVGAGPGNGSGGASSSLSSLSTAAGGAGTASSCPYTPIFPLLSHEQVAGVQARPQSMHIVLASAVAAAATPDSSSVCSTPPPQVAAIQQQQQQQSTQSSPTPSSHYSAKTTRSLPISGGASSSGSSGPGANGDASSVDGGGALPGWSVSLFRKELQAQPADKALTWMKEALTKPLLQKTDKSMKKEVVELFKYVQQYMDDRKTKLSRPQLAVTVTQRGWANAGLRDELYMMLCKQTTNNPRDESLYRGWELLATCLAFFPPSAVFRPYLEGYILRHLEPQQPGDPPCPPRLPHYARASHRRLQRACQAGARRGTQGLTSEEVWHAKQTILSRAMFGSTLQEVLQLQMERFPELRLPWIQTALSEQVLRNNGAGTEGIFRVPGDIDSVNALKVACEQWELPESLCSDPHVPASLLKLWYRELAEPLIPFDYYEACLAAQDDPTEAANIVARLPELNRLCLIYLVRFLQVFAAEESVSQTKMDVNNLAMVMAPNVLRSQASDPKVIFENTRPQMAFLRLLIMHLDTTEIDGLR